MVIKMKLGLKKRFCMLAIFSVTAIGGYAGPMVDPQEALNDWLSSNTKQNLQNCVMASQNQMQQYLVLNPTLDNSTFTLVSNGFLLTCLYGLTMVQQSLCLGQPAGACTPVTLLVPTAAQISTAQAQQNAANNLQQESNQNIYGH
jgi:hypothetical protein